jgi:hypothetical protein
MIKSLAVVSLFSALSFGTAGLAVAQTHEPEHKAVQAESDQPPCSFCEGRSLHYPPSPGTFYGTDEKGYPTGAQENPQT